MSLRQWIRYQALLKVYTPEVARRKAKAGRKAPKTPKLPK